MAIPVIDFSKLFAEERAKTMAQIANGCEEWGFFQVLKQFTFIVMPSLLVILLCQKTNYRSVLQLINHGIPEELLERVKKVCSECYKLEREENFKNSTTVKPLNGLVEKKSGEKLENVDWEDVFTLLDDNEWPERTPGFRYIYTENQ